MNIREIVDWAGNAVETKIIKDQGNIIDKLIKEETKDVSEAQAQASLKSFAGAVGGSVNGGITGAAGGAVVGGVVGALDDDQTVLNGMGKGILIGGGIGSAANGIAGGIRGTASLTGNAEAVAKSICRFGAKAKNGVSEATENINKKVAKGGANNSAFSAEDMKLYHMETRMD